MTSYSAGLAALAATLGIDVGLLHNIVHGPASGAGSTVTTEGGSVPTLAKAAADLASAMGTWAGLTALTGTGSASGDLWIVYDVSAGAMKAMTRAELKVALIDQQLGYVPESPANKGVANGYAELDSGGKVPTAQLPAAILTGMRYQGTWNASTNSPTLVSSTGTQGYVYRVSTAGSTTLDGISSWSVGDHVVFNGTTWEKWEGVLTSAELIAALGFTPANKAGDTLTGDLAQGTAYKFLWTGRGGIGSSADGVLVLLDTAGTSFGRLQFGGTTSSFPAIKRSGTTLAGRLADDTDDAPFSGSAFKTTAGNVNAKTGTSYSLVDADNGKVVTLSNASAITLTVPSGLAAGFSCTLVQLGAGQVTITPSSTTLRHRNGLKLGGQYAQAGLFYITTDTYSVGGDLTT